MDFGTALMIFILAGFIGYYVVWGITPSLHAPLMSVSNAISGIVIIGAITAVSSSSNEMTLWLGFCAIIIAAINVFGGFAISHRMLQMFRPHKQQKEDHHE